ncbi:LOW QUALITY PROTEIN: hypothetical protein BC937DRAFT_95445 [Endogone sp. FLAS-F59071]|nr:LOW QUALITY PROTEIN: hypothetical protein BC937DRAFT_95445 [Endogone sp. FLAS-F59071]|eukprot:RUS13352.1 LOW QUALITY PROTEIN: hypothetical protein BC937DRAFT_95445 [Endogone sp. FLAS-F59071]
MRSALQRHSLEDIEEAIKSYTPPVIVIAIVIKDCKKNCAKETLLGPVLDRGERVKMETQNFPRRHGGFSCSLTMRPVGQNRVLLSVDFCAASCASLSLCSKILRSLMSTIKIIESHPSPSLFRSLDTDVFGQEPAPLGLLERLARVGKPFGVGVCQFFCGVVVRESVSSNVILYPIREYGLNGFCGTEYGQLLHAQEVITLFFASP